MAGGLGSSALPPRGAAADVMQLSDSHFQTSGNASQGATMSSMFLSKSFFWILALLRTWKRKLSLQLPSKKLITERSAEELAPLTGS
jgi:hypothetical protein